MILNFGLLVQVIVIQETIKLMKALTTFFKMYKQSAEDVIKAHEQIYSYVDDKMKTIRQGLKSYRTLTKLKR